MKHAIFAIALLAPGLASAQVTSATGPFDGVYRGPMINVGGNEGCGTGRTVTWRIINSHIALKRRQDASPMYEMDVAADGSFQTSKVVTGIAPGVFSANVLSGSVEGRTLRAAWKSGVCGWSVVLEKVDK